MAGRSLPYRHTILSSDSWSFERARKYAHRRALTEEQQAEDRLARGLDIIHRAKHRGVLEHRRKRNGNANQRGLAPVLMRRHLSAIAIAAWSLGLVVGIGSVGREKGEYIPADAVHGPRHEFHKEPYSCEPVACYLCGDDFETKPELVKQWASRMHPSLPDLQARLALSTHRIEAEMRKWVFCDDASIFFEVRGEEMRRAVGDRAHHLPQSQPAGGAGSMNYTTPEATKEPRQLVGCAVCAMRFWLEDPYDLHLFTPPADPDAQRRPHRALPRQLQQRPRIALEDACTRKHVRQ